MRGAMSAPTKRYLNYWREQPNGPAQFLDVPYSYRCGGHPCRVAILAPKVNLSLSSLEYQKSTGSRKTSSRK